MIRVTEPNRYPSFVLNSSTCINCEPNNPRNKVCLSIKCVATNTKTAADVHQKAAEEARQDRPDASQKTAATGRIKTFHHLTLNPSDKHRSEVAINMLRPRPR
ncbi:hypothetical protein CEXT_524661 [Caerostris extrusa]|uniref:Uncharacterized protein n=1 Tax=Caerostris extrusa TaxID=172846 RepID=A0AAV4SVX9_CAEEX|nr:hypothetical protein CEXT_524661 [Caerostris extrusa]